MQWWSQEVSSTFLEDKIVSEGKGREEVWWCVVGRDEGRGAGEEEGRKSVVLGQREIL
jgi:hypothetical protein